MIHNWLLIYNYSNARQRFWSSRFNKIKKTIIIEKNKKKETLTGRINVSDDNVVKQIIWI